MRLLKLGSVFGLILFLQVCTGTMWRMRLVKAKTSLRKIESAEKTFRQRTGRYGKLQELSSAGLIAGDLANGLGDGYRFEVRAKDDSYSALAIPSVQDDTLPAYYLDQTGVLRQNLLGKEPSASDPQAPET